MDWHWLWLTVASFLAGLLNAVAGGGSFLSFPAMLSMKILPVQANATNTVALWPGQITSIAAYRDDIRKNLRISRCPWAWPVSSAAQPALWCCSSTPQMTFLHLVPWLLLMSSSIFAFTGPVSRWLARRKGSNCRRNPSTRRAACRSFWRRWRSAFISATSAPERASCSSLCSRSSAFEDLHEINALKVVSTTLANGIAFIIFVAIRNKVVWRYCLLAMVVLRHRRLFFGPLRPPRSSAACFAAWSFGGIGLFMSAWFFWRQSAHGPLFTDHCKLYL
jgi:hypothetical protein